MPRAIARRSLIVAARSLVVGRGDRLRGGEVAITQEALREVVAASRVEALHDAGGRSSP